MMSTQAFMFKIVDDNRLGFKEKGMMFFVLFNGWERQPFNIDVFDSEKEGKDSLLSGLKKLEKFGYLGKVDNGWEVIR